MSSFIDRTVRSVTKRLTIRPRTRSRIRKLAKTLKECNLDQTFDGVELHEAIWWKDENLFKLLIEGQRDINLHEKKCGDTPLHVTVTVRSVQMLDVLLAMDADVNATNNAGQTPLHLAASSGQIDVAVMLLDHGCNVNVVDNMNNTPLSLAIIKNHVHMVRLFLLAGVSTDHIEKSVSYAIENNFVDIIDLLSGQEGISDLLEMMLISKLQTAVSNGNILEVEALFKMKVNVNYSPDWPSILHIAISANIFRDMPKPQNHDFSELGNRQHMELHKIKIVKKLIDYGANVNVADEEGNSPLHLAIKKQYLSLIKLLLESDANVNAKNNHGKSCLHMAVEDNNIPVVKLLIQWRCDINVVDRDGVPPVAISLRKHHSQMLKVLLQDGAEIGKMRRIVEHAINSGFQDIINILHENEESNELLSKLLKEMLYDSVWVGDVDKVQFLLSVGVEILNGDQTLAPVLVHALLSNPLNCTACSPHPSLEMVETVKRKIVELLIINGAELNPKSHPKWKSPLYYAVVQKYKSIVKLFLDWGADINGNDELDAMPLLQTACLAKDIAMVRMLINSGCKICDVAGDSHPPLIIGILNNDPEMVELLMQTDIDFVTADPYIKYAIDMRHRDVLNVLFANGADPDILLQPLHMAIVLANEEDIKFLLSLNVNFGALKKSWYQIFVAFSHLQDAEEKCERLLQSGFDCNAENSKRETLLHYAARHNLLSIVKLLIKYGCNLNSVDEEAHTPLHNAIVKNRAHIVKLLLESGAELGDVNESLEIAIRRRHLKSVKAFFNFGGDKNLLIELLHNAAYMVDEGSVAFLIAAGAKVTTINKYGFPILNFAILSHTKHFKSFHFNTMDITLACLECSTNSDIEDESWESKKCKLVKYLISNGANINAKDCLGMTALHLAADNGYEQIVDLLIHLRSKIDAKSDDGWTPLYYAVSNERPSIVKLLLNHGASISIKDEEGNTLLHLAAAYGAVESAKLLLDSGLDLNAVNKLKRTSLFAAVAEQQDKMVKLLLDSGINTTEIKALIKIAVALRDKGLTKALTCNSENMKHLKNAIHCAILSKNKDIIDFCLALGIDISV